MGWLFGLVLQGQVWASVPLQLPEAENPAHWRTVLVLGDLELGPAVGRSWIRVTDEGTQWKLVVRDRSGHLHELMMAAPNTPSDRERLVLLAASLLAPSATHSLPERTQANAGPSHPNLPPLPPLPPLSPPNDGAKPTSTSRMDVTPSFEEPETTPVVIQTDAEIERDADVERDADAVAEQDVEEAAEQDAVVDLEPLSSEPATLDSLAETPSTPIAEPSPLLNDDNAVTEIDSSPLIPANLFKVVATGGFRWTTNSISQPTLAVSGARLRGRHVQGVRVAVSPWAPLTVVEGERSHSQLSAMATWFVQRQRLSAGMGLGVRILAFRDLEPSLQTEVWTPTVSLGGTYNLARMGPLELSVEPLLQLDLRSIDLRIDEQHVADWSPLAVTTALSIGWIRGR